MIPLDEHKREKDARTAERKAAVARERINSGATAVPAIYAESLEDGADLRNRAAGACLPEEGLTLDEARLNFYVVAWFAREWQRQVCQHGRQDRGLQALDTAKTRRRPQFSKDI